MHRLMLILLSALLIVAPVVAQEPTPAAPQGEIASAIRETGQVTESIGAATVIAVVLAVGSVIVTGLFIFGFFWFFIRPLLKSNTDANNQITNMSASSVQAQLLTAQTQERTALELVKVATYMSAMSTKTDDDARTKAAASQVVRDVNAHTDTAVQPIDGKLQKVAETLEELKKDVVTKQTLKDAINPLVEKIDAALQVIHDLQQPDAPPAPAPETTPADGATLSSDDT